MEKSCRNLKYKYRFEEELMSVVDISGSEPETVLSGKPCKLLQHLMDSEGRVVGIAEFQQKVWGKSVVSNASIKDYIAQIRSALNDSASDPEFIETVRGQGYRYLGGIAAVSNVVAETDLYPTIAVVPPLFCGSTNSSYKLAGQIIAANIIESLSRSPILNVISPFSTRQFTSITEDVDKIGSALGADYVVTGIYSCKGDTLTLASELAHIPSSRIVHTKKLSGHIDVWNDLGNDHLQSFNEELVSQILGHEIDLASTGEYERMPLHSLMINAILSMHSSSQRAFFRAEGLLQSVIKRKQNNPMALALLAQWHLMHMNRQSGLNSTADSCYTDNVFRYAEMALDLNPMHPHANAIYGSLEARLNNNPQKALRHHNIAMTGNPNHPLNHCFKASAYTYQDDIESREQAVEHANHAIKLSPFDPQLYLYKTVAATANYHAGNLENAFDIAMQSHTMNSNHTSNLRTLISILVDLENWKLVDRYKNELMQLDPTFSISMYKKYGPGKESEFGQRIAVNLETAGVPHH